MEFWLWIIGYAVGMTYLVWGFVVSFQIVLAMSGAKWALRWIKSRYRYKTLYIEVLVFYPMILLGYLFLELLPHYIFGVKRLTSFDMDTLFKRLFEE